MNRMLGKTAVGPTEPHRDTDAHEHARVTLSLTRYPGETRMAAFTDTANDNEAQPNSPVRAQKKAVAACECQSSAAFW